MRLLKQLIPERFLLLSRIFLEFIIINLDTIVENCIFPEIIII